jgi:hypothetical protein
MPNALHEFRKLAWRAGGRDLLRIEANAKLAIHKGMTPADTLGLLTKNTPDLFDEKLALERQRMPSNFSSTPRQSASQKAANGRKDILK